MLNLLLYVLISFPLLNHPLTSSTLLFFLLFLLPLNLRFNNPVPFISNLFYIDSLSFTLSRLRLLVIGCSLLASLHHTSAVGFKQSFTTSLYTLLILLFLSFRVANFFLFYVTFEASILPTFILILGWGNQPERSQARKYFFIYTVVASLPLLLSIILSHEHNYHITFIFPWIISLDLPFTFLWGIFSLLAFIVKLPLFIVHVWLPKAHVEAPVAGSMVLAALLLKLGGFGIVRLSQVVPALTHSPRQFFLVWACTGGVFAALLCSFQNDIKVLIAMSSVAHIALVLTGLITYSYWGLLGAQRIIIGHGFCSSGLFCAANMIYERFRTRSLLLLKNTQAWLPTFTLWWFLLCSANIARPPTLNLLGEILSISSTFSWAYTFSPFLALLIFLAAVYSLFLFRRIQHGKPFGFVSTSHPLTLREFLLLLLHLSPLNLFLLGIHTLLPVLSLISLGKILSCGLKEI